MSIQNSTVQNDFLSVHEPGYALYNAESGVRVLSLFNLAKSTYSKLVEQSWQQKNAQSDQAVECLVSQPLLLPVILPLSDEQLSFVLAEQEVLANAGIVFVEQSKNKIQIRQFPALLREQDVSNALVIIIDELNSKLRLNQDQLICESNLHQSIGLAMVLPHYDETQADILLKLSKKLFHEQLSQQLLLNSIPLDLTSHIKKLF